MGRYRHLFSPIQLGGVRVPNRVVFSAHLTNYAQENLPQERLMHYYRERASGGAGLIITEEQSIHPSDHAYEKLIHAYHPHIIPYYQRLTKAVQREGSKIFCQLNHNGLQGFSFFNDEALWGPSPVEDGLFHEIPQSIDLAQIEEVVAGYAKVTAHAREGGFDGVELQTSHSSLLRQFLSPYTNQRQDAYGGSRSARLRLLLECVKAVRGEAGGMAVGVRLCTDELLEGGMGIEDTLHVAKALGETGLVDYLNTSIGTTANLFMVEGSMSTPAAYQSGYTARVRQQVEIPVIGVGRINDPMLADRLLDEGVMDLVGVVRGQIADAQWSQKAREDKAEEIRKCIACNQYCIGLMGLNSPLSCIQNPANGMEGVWGNAHYHQATKPLEVWVAGAGPAGLEASITCARHGHHVRLFESEESIGGKVNWITRIAERAEYGDLLRNKQSELKRFGVTLELGETLDCTQVIRENVDALVVATGQSEGRMSHIQGMDHRTRVQTPLQVLETAPKGHGAQAMVVDEVGGHQAMNMAEFLLNQGWRVLLTSSALQPGQHLGVTLDVELWFMRQAGKPLQVQGNVVLLDATADPVLLNILTQVQTSIKGVDLIVPVQHGLSQDALFHALHGKLNQLYRVGDALAPKDVGQAILDGHRAGRTIHGMDCGWK